MGHDTLGRGRSPMIVRNGTHEYIDLISALAAAINPDVVKYYYQ